MPDYINYIILSLGKLITTTSILARCIYVCMYIYDIYIYDIYIEREMYKYQKTTL